MASHRALPSSISLISCLALASTVLVQTVLVQPQTALAQTEIQRQVPAEANGVVEIDNIAGSITVTGWERSEVEVTGVLGRGVEGLEIGRRGGRIEIEVEQGRGHGASTQLEIRLPKGSRVQIDTVSAEVRVSGVSGRIEVETVSGSVEIEGRPSTVEIQTVSGRVDIEDFAERANVETVAGTIRLRGGRDLEASTVSGRIDLEGLVNVESLELGVVSGSIDFTGSLARGADVKITSHNGSIDLTLPASVSARFEVSSFSGRIDNELGPPARRERFSPARELEFTTGSGDAHIQVESFSGSVTLRKQ